MRMPSQMAGGMNPNMMMMGGMKQGMGNMMGMPNMPMNPGMVGASNNSMPGAGGAAGSWQTPPAMSSPQHRQSPGLAGGPVAAAGGPETSMPGGPGTRMPTMATMQPNIPMEARRGSPGLTAQPGRLTEP